MVSTNIGPFNLLWSNWKTIRDEALALDQSNLADFDRDGKGHAAVFDELVKVGPHWIPAWKEPKNVWLVWPLVLWDDFPLGDAECPKTCRLLRRLRGLKVAAFSLFRPRTILGLHTHPELAEEGLLTFHLGLTVTHPCFLWTGNQFHPEESGSAFIFDGGKPHYAFNASLADRLILYCEFKP